MLQVQVIRKQRDWVLERLAVKHFSEPGLVDRVIELDDQRKSLLTASEVLLARRNAASKEIGGLMAAGKKDEAENLKLEVGRSMVELDEVSAKLAAAEKELTDTLVKLPNLPSEQVPVGRTPEDNVNIRQGGEIPVLPEGSVPHWDLIKKYDIVDFETGVKLTGSGFPVYKGKGAKLQRALIQYFLDFNTAAGYTEYIPP